MEPYGYPYLPTTSAIYPPEGQYPDRGDGVGDYYGMRTILEDQEITRRSHMDEKGSQSRSDDTGTPSTISRSRSRTRSSTHSNTRSRSETRSRTYSRSRTVSRVRELELIEPSFLDAFRVLYLQPNKSKKSKTQYLATKKRQDRIQELLKSDGLGSKRWLFYPRPTRGINSENVPDANVSQSRESCDRRVKVDGEYFRRFKRSEKMNSDAPIAKLSRWELILYKKFGFIQAI